MSSPDRISKLWVFVSSPETSGTVSHKQSTFPPQGVYPGHCFLPREADSSQDPATDFMLHSKNGQLPLRTHGLGKDFLGAADLNMSGHGGSFQRGREIETDRQKRPR